MNQDPISLETPVGSEEDSELGDFVEDNKMLNPYELTNRSLLREQLDGVLNSLSSREEKVLRYRYGLDDGSPKTLEEVGKIFKVTRERIRQIEVKALRKLRHPSRRKNQRISKYNRVREAGKNKIISLFLSFDKGERDGKDKCNRF